MFVIALGWGDILESVRNGDLAQTEQTFNILRERVLHSMQSSDAEQYLDGVLEILDGVEASRKADIHVMYAPDVKTIALCSLVAAGIFLATFLESEAEVKSK